MIYLKAVIVLAIYYWPSNKNFFALSDNLGRASEALHLQIPSQHHLQFLSHEIQIRKLLHCNKHPSLITSAIINVMSTPHSIQNDWKSHALTLRSVKFAKVRLFLSFSICFFMSSSSFWDAPAGSALT